jgi:hypothetical protein
MHFTDAGLGPAGVVSLADPVELPDWNDSEVCHALHVTLLLSRPPSTVIPRSTNLSRPVEAYFYSSPAVWVMQGVGVTTVSRLIELLPDDIQWDIIWSCRSDP